MADLHRVSSCCRQSRCPSVTLPRRGQSGTTEARSSRAAAGSSFSTGSDSSGPLSFSHFSPALRDARSYEKRPHGKSSPSSRIVVYPHGALRQSGTPTARCAVVSFFCFHAFCSRCARPCCHRRWRHGRLDQDPPGAALLSSPCAVRLAAGSTHLLCCGSLFALRCQHVPPRHLHPS